MTETQNEITLVKERSTDEVNFSLILKILLIIYSAINVFVTVDYYITTPEQAMLTKNILDGFGHPRFFSLLDLLVICLCTYLMIFYNLSLKNASPLEKFFFYFAIICFILKIANPNSRSENPILGLPLMSEIGNYSYLLFFGTIISIPKSAYFQFVQKLFKYSALLAVFRCIILLGLFAAGQSRSFFFGIKSCLLEEDTLLLFGFFQSIIFALYLATKDRKYMIAWILLVLVQIFSSRRSPLFTALFCNAIVFMFYYIRGMKMAGKIATIFAFFLIVLVFPIVVSNISPKAKVYVDRYMGVFSTDSYSTDAANSDSGHFEQSLATTKSALKVGFWGMGYGNKLILEGAFSINGEYFIHNCFAAIWALHGVYMVIFYLAIVLVVLFQFFQLVFVSDDDIFHFVMVKVGIIVFFLLYMHALYYTTLNFLTSTKIEYILLLMMSFMFKFGKKEFKELIPYFNVSIAGSKNKSEQKFISFK